MPHWQHPSIYATPRAKKKYVATRRPVVTGPSPESVSGELFQQALAQFAGTGPVSTAPHPVTHARAFVALRRPSMSARKAPPGLRMLHLAALQSLMDALRRSLSPAARRFAALLPRRHVASVCHTDAPSTTRPPRVGR